MADRRARNNLASKKSYEKSLERRFATEYEYAVVEHHRAQTQHAVCAKQRKSTKIPKASPPHSIE